MIRNEVRQFMNLGPLPGSNAAVGVIAQHQSALQQISSPVTDEAARELTHLFGPDECYGLAWTLLHLIESSLGGLSPIPWKTIETSGFFVSRIGPRE
jgi:hypothetical protein